MIRLAIVLILPVILLIPPDYCNAQWELLPFGEGLINNIAARGTHVYLASGHGFYSSTDAGVRWDSTGPAICTGWDKFCEHLALLDSTLYISTANCQTGAWRGNGTQWVPMPPDLAYFKEITRAGGALLATIPGNSGGVIRSTDGGANWTYVVDSTNVWSVAAFDNVVLAGVWGTTGGILRSTDYGSTWSGVTTGLPTWVFVNGGFAIVDSLVFVGLREGVYRSSNKGLSWEKAGETLTGKWIFGLFAWNVIVFAGTDSSAFASTDFGQTWRQIATGNLRFFAVGDNYFYGANTAVVYRRPLATVLSTGRDETSVPAVPSLAQNYPNPFNPTTVVSYQLSVASSVKLAVYDILGREVTVLVNERKARGSYQVQFDASGLASGVYIYRLTAGQYVESRRMVLVK